MTSARENSQHQDAMSQHLAYANATSTMPRQQGLDASENLFDRMIATALRAHGGFLRTNEGGGKPIEVFADEGWQGRERRSDWSVCSIPMPIRQQSHAPRFAELYVSPDGHARGARADRCGMPGLAV